MKHFELLELVENSIGTKLAALPIDENTNTGFFIGLAKLKVLLEIKSFRMVGLLFGTL